MTRPMQLLTNGLRPQARDRLPACPPCVWGRLGMKKITKNHFTPTSVEVRLEANGPSGPEPATPRRTILSDAPADSAILTRQRRDAPNGGSLLLDVTP